MRVRTRSVDVPGRDEDLAWLLERCRALADTRHGEIVFIAGEEGSGRRALLTALASRAPIRTLSGAFRDGAYEPELRDSQMESRVAAVVEDLAALAGYAHPVASLIAHAIAASRRASELWAELRSDSEVEHILGLAPAVLRRAALEGPVVCVIHDADGADGGWWDELIMSLGVEVCDDLPLLLVLSVQGPAEVGVPSEGEPPSQSVARILGSRELATWRSLGPVRRADLSRWVGPSDHAVIHHLDEVGGGVAELAAQTWRRWVAEGVVARRDNDDRWAFTEHGRDRALGPMQWVVAGRIRRLVGDTGVESLECARDVLSCAALEGATFTANAVVAALDRPDAFPLIEIAAQGDIPILTELPTVTVTDEAGTRELRRYRFTARLDYLVLRRYGLRSERRRALSSRLAAAVSEAWGSDQARVAGALARLCREAGELEMAAAFERIRNSSGSRDALLWRAEQILQRPRVTDSFSRNREAEVLLAASSATYNFGPFHDGLRYAEGVRAIADILSYRALGSYYAAWFYRHLGNENAARARLHEALDGFKAIGNKDGVVDATHQLANLDLALGNLEAARERYLEVLGQRRKRGDRVGESTVLQALGDLEDKAGDPGSARQHYEAALKLARELNDAPSEASNLSRIASLDAAAGSLREAELALRRALDIQRAVSDRRNEAATLGLLGQVLTQRGRPEEARAAYAAAVAREVELGHREGEAIYRHWLSELDDANGRDDEARDGYQSALRLYGEVGDDDGEWSVLIALAELDSRCGPPASGRSAYARLGELARRNGDKSIESQALFTIARIDAEADELERARTASLESLGIAREIGEPAVESVNLFLLAHIANAEGRIPEARAAAEQALAIDVELNDHEGQQAIRAFLAELPRDELGRGKRWGRRTRGP